MIDFSSLPSADSVFQEVAHAAHVDIVELQRMPDVAMAAGQALDLGLLDDLAKRIGQIAARNARNLHVQAVVTRVSHTVAFQRRKARRMSKGVVG